MEGSVKFPIEAGMQVFLQPTGNLARMKRQPRHGTISKIGRKYFYVDMGVRQTEKFSLETFENVNEDCNSAWVLWESEASYQRWLGHCEKFRSIRDFFRRCRAEDVPSKVLDRVYELVQTVPAEDG
ncbi:hypothetical protein [uncultured Flavonifractor sp.]|uniref:beta barrel domain-containing protein n=1 Tax=uncultured Flavonifractor sp. TaxID=1193534 RepID=UPI002599482A|nr:hypothetical protein [uncultured Flavonifractor sp.]